MKIKSLLSLFLLLCSMTGLKAQVVLSEGFNVTANSSTFPPGWTVVTDPTSSTNGCYTTGWEQVPSGGFVCSKTSPVPTPLTNSGTGMAGFNSWDIFAPGWSELYTPAIPLQTQGSYTVTFSVFEEWDFVSDSLIVALNTSATMTGATVLLAYQPQYFPTATSSGWTQYTFNVPLSYAGSNLYVIFRGVSAYNNDLFFDDVSVTYTPPTPCSGTPAAPIITTAAMTTPFCNSGTKTIAATDPNAPLIGGITYQWETAGSAAGPWTAVTGATSLSFTTPTLTSSAWYRLALTCAATPSTVYSGTYLVQVGAPQPSVITGPGTFCPGDVATYTVSGTASTTYNWTLPSGWTGTSTTNSIQVTPSASPTGTISVTATDACGTSVPRTLTINAGSAPAPPAGITGNALFCSNAPQTYTVPPVSGATSYAWTLPSGWVGTSNTNTINVTNTIASGTISVRAVNGCGNSLATNLAVTPLSTLDPVGAIFGKDTVCSGSLQTYYIHPIPGATSYVWTLPYGWSGTTTDTMIRVFPGANDGTISVTAYVSCATSAPNSKTIKVLPAIVPTVTLATPSGTLCAGRPITITANATGGGSTPGFQWYKNGSIVTNTGSTYVSNLVPGDELQVMMTSSELCANPTQVTSNKLAPTIVPATIPGINIDLTPGSTVCTNTMLNFTSNTNDVSANTRYQWMRNSDTLFGSVATSYSAANLQDGDTIYVILKSNALCAPPQGIRSNMVVLTIRDTLVPEVTVIASPGNVINVGDEVTFTATPVNGGATPTYQWYRNNVTIPFATEDTYTSGNLRPGDHISVRMLSYLDCAYPRLVSSDDITITAYDLSVTGQSKVANFKFYPNPSQGSLRIKGDLSTFTGIRGIRIEILNPIGQIVHRVESPATGAGAWETSIELPAQLANGQYLLQLRSTGDGQQIQAVKSFQLIR
jgi:hypothetical protein